MRLKTLLFLAALCPSAAVASGGSYLVDDASTTPSGHCQLESWLQAFQHGKAALWNTPACGLGPVELSWQVQSADGRPARARTPALKWQLVNGDDGGMGVAVEANRTSGPSALRGWQAYAALTTALDTARDVILAMNLGMSRHGGERSAVAGAGVQWQATAQGALLVERIRDGHVWTSQAGWRWSIGDSTIDLVAGVQRSQRWVNLGWNQAF